MRAPPFNFLKNCALLLCLLAPSVWMIATIPPLWRDSDAYNQLTVDPLITTFWGHGPAYSYLARVPLFLGQQLERWWGIGGTAAASGSSPLTDTGVWLLIIIQHLALAAAAFYFIRSISSSFWIRLTLALIWASNAIFYTFAHCTGSETLSLILIVLLVAKGLRLIRSRREPLWTDWYLFAITLCLSLLSRHVNVLLVLLLPTAFVLSWTQNLVVTLFASREKRGRWQRALGSRQLRQAVIAIAVGIACAAVANSLPHNLARKTKLRPHSRVGHTLMWRLQFMKTLPPPERTALLQRVTVRTHSPEARRLLSLLGQMHDEGADVVGRAFAQRAAPILFPGEARVPWEKVDVALNQMAYAFLLPPTPELLHAATSDFAAAVKMSATGISDQLFVTTSYFFEHEAEMSGCAGLVTFRNASAETINRMPSEHVYFHLWQSMSYKEATMIWFGTLLVFAVIATWKKMNLGGIAAFGVALVAIGMVMTASACLLTEFLPRYALPMWLLLLLSLYTFLGTTADLLTIGKEKSAGQLPRLG